MKNLSRIVWAIAFFAVTPAFTAAPRDLALARKNLYESNPALYSQINKAVGEVNTFAALATLEELKNVKNYLDHYRSWYQSVKPASPELQAALSNNAHSLINELKKRADEHFFIRNFIKTQPIEPGQSKLSDDGNSYYQEILNELDSIITRKEQTSRRSDSGKPLPQYAPLRQ